MESKRQFSAPSLQLRHVRSAIHLYPFEEIPKYLQDNPYITAGYCCYLSAKGCLKTMFVLSNELVNIWTHLGMVFIWMALLLYDQIYLIRTYGGKQEDRFIHFMYVVCVVLCMSASAGYHTFTGHVSKSVCTKWHRLDVCGIIIGMLGCYIPGIHYGYWCRATPKYAYLSLVIVMILISVFVITHPRYLTESWKHKRIAHLSSLVLFGIVPAAHWVITTEKSEVAIFFPYIRNLYLILGLALLVYISRFPERLLPGKFNLIGSSHNIWHILTAYSFIFWRSAALTLMAYRYKQGCPTA